MEVVTLSEIETLIIDSLWCLNFASATRAIRVIGRLWVVHRLNTLCRRAQTTRSKFQSVLKGTPSKPQETFLQIYSFLRLKDEIITRKKIKDLETWCA